MIKYTAFYGIFKFEILKSNPSNTQKEIKGFYKDFNTWTEAHAFLKTEAQTAYNLAKAKYEAAAAELNKVVEMVDPELKVNPLDRCDTDNRVCDLCGGCLE